MGAPGLSRENYGFGRAVRGGEIQLGQRPGPRGKIENRGCEPEKTGEAHDSTHGIVPVCRGGGC